MKKVFCFGELLLRMSPGLEGQWLKSASMPVYLGGAELNVATALAKWNVPVKYCSALPVNFLGKEIITALNEKKIDVSPIQFSGNRIGCYFLQQGADLKKVDVIYDRAGSSFSALRTGMINWSDILEDCGWFHFSAISPAISEATALLCLEGLRAAHSLGLTVSIDLNYRAKLWQYGKQPTDLMPAMLEYCHVVMGNIWAADQLLGIPSSIENSTGQSHEDLLKAATASMDKIEQSYPLVNTQAFTFRLSEKYFGVLRRDHAEFTSRVFTQEAVVDRVGSGDCFMAGLIYGICHHNNSQDIIDFSAAAAVGKMKEIGDATDQTAEAILTTINQTS